MTDKLQAAIREMRSRHGKLGWFHSECELCGFRWPCDAARALDALEKAHERAYVYRESVLQCRECSRYPGEVHPAHCWIGNFLAAVEEALSK